MCGWPPPGKRSFGVQRRGRLQSCVRPVGAVRVDCWPCWGARTESSSFERDRCPDETPGLARLRRIDRLCHHASLLSRKLQNVAQRPKPPRPRAGSSHAGASLDHLVGGGAEAFGRSEIDDQLELGRRLDRQVARLLALEDAIDVSGRAPELVDNIRPVGDQAAGRNEIPGRVAAGSRWRATIAAIRSRCALAEGPPSTINPSAGPRTNAATARWRASASRTSIGVNSTPNEGAAPLDGGELADQGGDGGIAQHRRARTSCPDSETREYHYGHRQRYREPNVTFAEPRRHVSSPRLFLALLAPKKAQEGGPGNSQKN